MVITPEKVRNPDFVTDTARPEEPEGVRIVLSVCDCHKNEQLTFITEKANRVASVLGITRQQLECAAITAMIAKRPEVVACYKQRDLAEAKLLQLEVATPFISRPCHSFDIVSSGG